MEGGLRRAPLLPMAAVGLGLTACAGGSAPEPLYGTLTTTDAATAEQAMQRALETLESGTMTSWSDPDRFVVGSVMPLRTFKTASGLYCRELEEAIAIEGAVDRYRLVGCRLADGTWRLAQGPSAERREASASALGAAD